MSTQLLDIQPRELKFTFELKKQSSCAIQLHNISDQYVAFKVKTTSPKKYCVRPNVGIIKPKSKCDFMVIMQAQPSAPSDMKCKDKFLIQSTVVPFGTTEEDITPGMYAKDSGKHIEESKLKVILTSPSHLPVLLPTNGVMKQEPSYGTSVQKDKLLSGVENLPPHVIAKDVEDVKSAPVMESSRPCKDVELSPSKDVKPRPFMDVEDPKLKLGKDIEELKSKLNVLTSYPADKVGQVNSTHLLTTGAPRTILLTWKNTCNENIIKFITNKMLMKISFVLPFLFPLLQLVIALFRW